MRDVAANRHRQAVQPPFGTPDCQRIEQRLSWMLVPPVACIQHGAVHLLSQQVDRARVRVSNHQQIGMHGVQRQCGIDQCFTLFHAGCRHVHVHHVRAQPLARQFETGLGAGRSFEEHVDLGQTLKRVVMFDVLPVQIDIAVGQIQKGRNFVGCEVFDAKQVFCAKTHEAVLGMRLSIRRQQPAAKRTRLRRDTVFWICVFGKR